MNDALLELHNLFFDLDVALLSSVVASTGTAHVVQLEHVDVVVVLVPDHPGQVAVMESFELASHSAPGGVAVQVDLHRGSILIDEVVECRLATSVVAVYFRHDMNWF